MSNLNCAVSVLEHVVLRVKLELGGAYRRYSYSDYLYRSDKASLIRHNDVRRGDVAINLASPFGTTSQLLPHRPRDFVNSEGFNYWPFMSVRHWGEFSKGLWLANVSYSPPTHDRGYVLTRSLELNLFGTSEVPASILAVPAICDERCIGGCGGEGPFMCDVCKSMRDATTLQCVDSCSEGDKVQGRYCSPSANSSHTPSMIAMDDEPSLQTSKPEQTNSALRMDSTLTSISLLLCFYKHIVEE